MLRVIRLWTELVSTIFKCNLLCANLRRREKKAHILEAYMCNQNVRCLFRQGIVVNELVHQSLHVKELKRNGSKGVLAVYETDTIGFVQWNLEKFNP